MSVGFDPSTDFEDITDGLEAVTLNRRGSTPNTSIAHALRRKVTQGIAGKHEAQTSDGQYSINDIAWHLPDAEVGDDPLVSDSVIDRDNNRHTILQSIVIIDLKAAVELDASAIEITWSKMKWRRTLKFHRSRNSIPGLMTKG